ncbi:MAG: parvulin-like peptidyl-prolyl isomerase [Verrucomicrobiales bacterium]
MRVGDSSSTISAILLDHRIQKNLFDIMKITQQLLSAALVMAVFGTGFAANKEAKEKKEVVDEVVATLDGDPIFRTEVLAHFNPEMEAQIIELAKQDPKKAMAENQRIEHEFLNEIIARRLMVKVALRDGYGVSEEELKAAMTEMVQRQSPGTSLDQFLAAAGIPIEEFISSARESVVIRKLVEASTADISDPPEETLREYYRKYAHLFHRVETLRARHILFSIEGLEDPAEIEEKLRRADALLVYLRKEKDADFASVAARYSEGPSAERGGDLGEFSRGHIDPDFEDAAFALRVGEMSGVVKTRVGYHIIKLEARSAPKMMPFEKIQKELKADFLRRAHADKMRWHIERWREEADIQFVGPAAAPVAPKTPATVPAQP